MRQTLLLSAVDATNKMPPGDQCAGTAAALCPQTRLAPAAQRGRLCGRSRRRALGGHTSPPRPRRARHLDDRRLPGVPSGDQTLPQLKTRRPPATADRRRPVSRTDVTLRRPARSRRSATRQVRSAATAPSRDLLRIAADRRHDVDTNIVPDTDVGDACHRERTTDCWRRPPCASAGPPGRR
jgi:hypothetical protein